MVSFVNKTQHQLMCSPEWDEVPATRLCVLRNADGPDSRPNGGWRIGSRADMAADDDTAGLMALAHDACLLLDVVITSDIFRGG